MIKFSDKKFVIPKYLITEESKKEQVLDELQDLATFVSLSMELISSKKLERAKEALMQAAIKIESVTTTIQGGK